ncbi:MFS transporter [Leptospira sp. 2 VSF19]|uniref:MFS transporter n=1 Tax=Leptospira soteropolitanensis TaxID=2950025 RepID=A0AAW5VF08_9LEPT|nr:MFS transporter [Leptospira soteropolitanensis]MCW7492867.1 MFS transporter [Leptospira soteropolitanensis]MCW7500102.1 MFS transporter [Leptospira soteropolitanensis]MCW7522353.1 MFS transporter [Leptospira soteropolitanensis]MCW7526209.1 MFS transporter [Leptospira soteropolitanensis]MCW7529679.1 MFS transporter [Leptospira soteropolitanensis]
MNQLIFYFAFAIGTFASSCFLYSIVIFCQTLDTVKGFSGIVFFFLFLPFPIFFLYTGYLLDHYSKKWVVVSFQFFLFISSFSLGALNHYFLDHPLLLLPLAFVNGIGMTTVLPGRMAILREVMESHRLVFHTIAGNLLLIFAFGMSPLAVGWFREGNSYPSLFLILALFHFFSMIAFTLLRYDGKKWNPESNSKNLNFKTIPSFRANLQIVLEFLKVDSVSRQVMYMAILSMLALGPIQVILPKYVRHELGLGELARGKVLVFLGPGLFLGGILTILFHHLERKGLVLLIVFTLSSIFFLGFVPFGKPEATSFFLFCFGVTGGIVSSLLPAILQKRAEDGLRGRILSLYTVCFQFTPAVSGFLSALLADTIGSQLTFGILGGMFLCFALFSFLQYRELRQS